MTTLKIEAEQTIELDPAVLPPAWQFTDGEVSGMRAAGKILLVTAGLTFLSWLVTRDGLPLSAGIDLFLGLKLMRQSHSWRAWVMVRAAAGILFGVVGLYVALSGVEDVSVLGMIVLTAGHGAYCSALLLFLVGSPSLTRVRVGRWVFGGAVALVVVGVILVGIGSASRAEVIPETNLTIDVPGTAPSRPGR